MKKLILSVLLCITVLCLNSCCASESSNEGNYTITGKKFKSHDETSFGSLVYLAEYTVTDSLGNAETHQFLVNESGGMVHWPGCKYCKGHSDDIDFIISDINSDNDF